MQSTQRMCRLHAAHQPQWQLHCTARRVFVDGDRQDTQRVTGVDGVAQGRVPHTAALPLHDCLAGAHDGVAWGGTRLVRVPPSAGRRVHAGRRRVQRVRLVLQQHGHMPAPSPRRLAGAAGRPRGRRERHRLHPRPHRAIPLALYISITIDSFNTSAGFVLLFKGSISTLRMQL